jgi:hypothetical protein
MPRRGKTATAHSRLEEHRERVATEGMKRRELQEQQARAQAELERIGDVIAAAYASENEDAIAEALKAKEELENRVGDLGHRVAGVELRARHAREELDGFLAENAGDLIAEREETASRVAADLTEAVAAAVKARHAYDNERQHIDELVSRAPGATTRYDGVSTGYPWEAELKALERAYRQNPEGPPAPAARWAGRTYRSNMDAVHRRVQEQRRRGSGVVLT